MDPQLGIAIATILFLVGLFLIASGISDNCEWLYFAVLQKISDIYRFTLNLIIGVLPTEVKRGLKPCMYVATAQRTGKYVATAQRTGKVQRRATEHNALTQKIVDLFENQRKENFQFAVLILLSEESTRDVIFWIKFGGDYNLPDRFTNSAQPTYPPKKQFCNFIAARPDGEYHAEEQLMEQFDHLLESYQSTTLPACRKVVLFTWLLPCDKYCTKSIIEKLCGRGLEIILIYINTQKKDPTNEKKISQMLKEKGITVIKERCQRRLEPKHYSHIK